MKLHNEEWLRVRDIPQWILDNTGLVRRTATVYAWIHKGRKSYSGQLIRLQAFPMFGTLLVRVKDLEAFLKKIN